MNKIPITAIVVTKNEEEAIERCLISIQNFDEIVVGDSNSTDSTAVIARNLGAKVVPFTWNGQYPKKRQWCLDNLDLKYERVFFVDADEEVTGALENEIRDLDWECDAYFVKGRYVIGGKPLHFGLLNNKLCLFDCTKVSFPVVDDLYIVGMGEIEGHYQPFVQEGARVGQLRYPLRHHAYEDQERWAGRHERYANWEAQMMKREAYPKDPVAVREMMKQVFRVLPFRDVFAFLQSYILKQGFLDGKAGYEFARSRAKYYRLVSDFKRQYKSGA